MEVPDDFLELPISDQDDPDLKLLLENSDMTISVYVSYSSGGGADVLFQVFSGNETESGSVPVGSRDASYVIWNEDSAACFLYTLTDQMNQIQLYFNSVGRPDLAREVVSSIIQSITFN